MQPPDGDQISDPLPPQPPPVDPPPDAETARMPWAPAEAAAAPVEPPPAPVEPASAPAASTGFAQPGAPKPSGWTEAKGPQMTGCVVIMLVGAVAILAMFILLIYFGSQVSTILSTVGDSV